MKDVGRLRDAIRRLHGCDSFHVGSVAVHEQSGDATVWEGEVEVFALSGHPTAMRAYAWSHETDAGGRRYVAVLGVDPIKTALDAVRAHIIAEYEKTKQGSPQD
jgi:hypothetical protein